MGHNKKALPVKEDKEIKDIENEFGIGTGKKPSEEIELLGDDTPDLCCIILCCGGGGGGGAATMEEIEETIIL